MRTRTEGAVTIVGLGPAGPELVTVAAMDALRGAGAILLRTGRHPAARALMAELGAETCDDLYESGASFEAVYRAIADRVLSRAAEGAVVYAVPGDPSVGETSVRHVQRQAAERGIAVRVVPGVSFVGPALSLLGWDALDGVQVVDGMSLAARHYPNLDPDRPALVAQVYGTTVASGVKLVLLGAYPPEHPVIVVGAAGTAQARTDQVALFELDRGVPLDDLTTVAVPPLARPGSLADLADLVARLRAPDGCPWDRAQTHRSLRPFLLEETYEALHALDDDDPIQLCDELGDLLLQIVLHAQLAAESGEFTLPDVVAAIAEKVVRRHPHVFGSAAADTPQEVRVRWEEMKRGERSNGGAGTGPLAGLPATLPALARAQAAQRKLTDSKMAADPAGANVHSHARVVEAAGPEPAGQRERDRRIGGLLWSLVALAAGWGVDAEAALREETDRVKAETSRLDEP